jgi:hypothetical protein
MGRDQSPNSSKEEGEEQQRKQNVLDEWLKSLSLSLFFFFCNIFALTPGECETIIQSYCYKGMMWLVYTFRSEDEKTIALGDIFMLQTSES